MRLRTPQYGGSWTPVFRAETVQKAGEVVWPVSVGDRDLTCVICTPQRPSPSVLPPPVLSTLPLSVPVMDVAGPPGAGGQAEGDLVLLGLILSHLQVRKPLQLYSTSHKSAVLSTLPLSALVVDAAGPLGSGPAEED